MLKHNTRNYLSSIIDKKREGCEALKLGIAMSFPHSSPEEWAEKHREAGLEAIVFPCSYKSNVSKIDSYVKAANDNGLVIAEVGAWKNVMDLDENKREENIDFCIKQLELAEYVNAKCCVNISGAKGEVWDGAYVENYSEKTYTQIVETTQRIIDAVNPKNTKYTLEPMPHMWPDSPESYLRLSDDINRVGFGVHMDAVNMISSVERYFNNKEFVKRCFEMLGNITASCHVKDCILEHKLTVSILETECGNGGFDIKNYINEANKISVDMPMIIEHLSDINKYLNAVEFIKNL